MGAKFTKFRRDSDDESRTDSGSPMTKAIAVLLYSEVYSEDESEAISTPSCCSIDDAGDQRLEWIEEISALQDLEETMMQAKASEDVKQAKMLRKFPVPSLWSETSNDSIISPTSKSSDGGEGKLRESVAASRQSTSTGRRKSKGRYSTGSDTSFRKSSFVTIGENGGSKNKPDRADNTPSFESLTGPEPSDMNVNDVPEDIVLHSSFSSVSVLKTEEDLWREQEEWGSLNRRRTRMRRVRSRSTIPTTVSGDATPNDLTDISTVAPRLKKGGHRRKAFIKDNSTPSDKKIWH